MPKDNIFAVDVNVPRCGDFHHPQYGACAVIDEKDIPKLLAECWSQGIKSVAQLAMLMEKYNIPLTVTNLTKAAEYMADQMQHRGRPIHVDAAFFGKLN